ncbi:hypothetical protein Taro_023756 [Colocasia esculenta]|uniref:Uncharacterized protein n=1 Tax=Colocasia esculenta TaxID=4460 RepID=A0A843V7C1_COLES|nr:hypothetical protein [Colocasia esculenta]
MSFTCRQSILIYRQPAPTCQQDQSEVSAGLLCYNENPINFTITPVDVTLASLLAVGVSFALGGKLLLEL